MDRHEIGMIQPGGGSCFAHEPLAQVRGEKSLGPGHLECHVPAQDWVPGEEDDAESAPAYLAAKLKAAQNRAREFTRRYHGLRRSVW